MRNKHPCLVLHSWRCLISGVASWLTLIVDLLHVVKAEQPSMLGQPCQYLMHVSRCCRLNYLAIPHFGPVGLRLTGHPINRQAFQALNSHLDTQAVDNPAQAQQIHCLGTHVLHGHQSHLASCRPPPQAR